MSFAPVQRGYLASVDMTPRIVVPFQFNPASISDNRAVSYADRSAIDAPGKVYTGAGARTISFDLKFYEDAVELPLGRPGYNAAEHALAKLRMFLYPREDDWTSLDKAPLQGSSGRRLVAPPRCYFGFGAKILECVLTDLKTTEAQYDHALSPIRVDAQVTLHVIEDAENNLARAERAARKFLAMS